MEVVSNTMVMGVVKCEIKDSGVDIWTKLNNGKSLQEIKDGVVMGGQSRFHGGYGYDRVTCFKVE